MHPDYRQIGSAVRTSHKIVISFHILSFNYFFIEVDGRPERLSHPPTLVTGDIYPREQAIKKDYVANNIVRTIPVATLIINIAISTL
jgi:hypothetical protein